MRDKDEDVNEDYIYGRNAVLAFLEVAEADASRNSGQLDKIFLAQGSPGPDKRIDLIKALAKQLRVPVLVANKQQLEKLVGNESRHQGVVARLSQGKALELADFLQSIKQIDIQGNEKYQ